MPTEVLPRSRTVAAAASLCWPRLRPGSGTGVLADTRHIAMNRHPHVAHSRRFHFSCPRTWLALLVIVPALAGCSSEASGGVSFPGTEAGARQLVSALQKGDATFLPLLRPVAADLDVLFEPGAIDAMRTYVDTMYGEIKPEAVGAKEGQSEVILTVGTSDDFRSKTGTAAEFPGGYQDHGERFKPGIRWYRWQFVKPGETSGMAFDGLVHVNGRWIWIPKPWRAMR